MWTNELDNLHVVNFHTGFQSETVLHGKKNTDARTLFVKCLVSVDLFYLALIRVDRELGFTPKIVHDLTITHGIVLQSSRSQLHDFSGSKEMYRKLLRRSFRILRKRYGKVELQVLLCHAINVLNDMMESNCLVPSSLAFCTMCTLPITTCKFLEQEEQISMI